MAIYGNRREFWKSSVKNFYNNSTTLNIFQVTKRGTNVMPCALMQLGSWQQKLYKTGISNSKDVLRRKAQNVETTNKTHLTL
jgi:hypothetical protein